MSASKEAYWDSHPCKDCGEAPSVLDGDLCEACDEAERDAPPYN